MRVVLVLIVVSCTLLHAVPTATGRTWFVDQSGGGDFITIQLAVDSAAVGDTINIGPGRFDESFLPPDFPNNPTFINVTKSLTFLGSGMGQTIVGPAISPEFPGSTNEVGFAVFAPYECEELNLRDLTIENILGIGIYLAHGRISMERCEIRHCVWRGLQGRIDSGGSIRNCSFRDNGIWGIFHGIALMLFQPSVGVSIDSCDFESNYGTNIQVQWSGCEDIDIRNCRINHGANGIVFVDGASGTIDDCTITDQYLRGICLARAGAILLEGNEIELLQSNPIQVGICVETSIENLIMYENIVSSNGYVLWFDALVGTGEVCRNHFLRSSDTAWWVTSGDYYPLQDPRIIDLENNYWGTTDTDLLDHWIYDGNDDEDVDIYIDYIPLADGPVETEAVTWGAVKALFR